MRGRSQFHRKISAAFILATFLATGVFGIDVFAPNTARAELPVVDLANTAAVTAGTAATVAAVETDAAAAAAAAANTAGLVANDAKKSAWAVIKTSLTNTAAVAVLNGLNYFAQKVAYDTAVYVASGGKGQVPLIFSAPRAYFKTVGLDAAGEVLGSLNENSLFKKYGINVCVPKDPRAALNLKLGLISSLPRIVGPTGGLGSAPTPKCKWDSISSNWDTFTEQSTADVLDNVGVMFSPGESSLGAAIEINGIALDEVNIRRYTAGIEQSIGDGFKPVVDKISGVLKTPSSTVKKTFEYGVDEGFKVKDNTTTITAGAFGAGALGVLTASLQTFAGVLTDKLTKKIFEKGFVSVSSMLGLHDDASDNTLSFDGQPPLAGRASAELANASLLTPNILSVSSYNELLEFASCPDEGRTPSSCVIDQKLYGALSRVDSGVTVTLRQAIQQGYLNRNWQLLPLAHQKNLSGNCYNEAFCYSNLVKLRKARIIPAGWEIAANSPFNDISRPVTLGEAMDRFNDCPMTTGAQPIVDEAKLPDPSHPWCHLVDPEWVLKYPAASCRQRGPGPSPVSSQSSTRSQICADVATCVAEDASGNCIGDYGYCVREKSVWKLDADACPAQYASCTTYKRAGGGDFSYLSTTLDGAACNSQNAGCRQYSLSPNSVPNPGFEDVLDDAPRDWTLSGQARYHRGGRLSMRGSSAVGVSGASKAVAQIGGLLPGTSYRFSGSVLQEVENPGAIGTMRLAFLNDAGTAIAAGTLTTTCDSVAGGTAVELDIVSTSLGYLSGACEITLPADAVAAEITLSSNAAIGNRTWFDEIGLFGGSFSVSPLDSVFMNSKAEKCADDQAGCSQFKRLATGTLNMLRNPSFETADGDLPAYWKDATASRYENSTLLGQDGLSAYALSTTPVKQVVDGIMADAAYSFSIFSRREGSTDTTGTAKIQLYDSSIPPVLVPPVSTDGCDLGSDGKSIVVDLAVGAEYALSECRFTTSGEVGSAVVSLYTDTNAAASKRILVDALQLELAVKATTFHAGYSPAIESVFLKKAPEGLNCVGSNPSAECAKYAPSCRRDEVGCNSYQPVDGGSAIPAVTTAADACPSECSGYDTFRQEPSDFSDAKFPLFLIPTTAQSCTAAEAGCSEFTNIERLAAGGESREYFSYLRLCAEPGPRSATYYTWEGNDDRGSGIRLRSWPLLRSNRDIATASSSDPTGGNAPCTKLAYDISGSPVCLDDDASVAAASCFKALVGLNPDCREFYDDAGNIHYRLYSKTVVSTADCKEYRITTTTEGECGSHGGFWRNGECRYRSFAAESVSCRAEVAGCRAYSGNASRNVHVIFTDTLEAGSTDGWVPAPGGRAGDVINSNESIAAAGHSLKVTSADAFKDVSSSIRGGRQYILNFWAKGTGDLTARFSQAAADSFTYDPVSGSEKPVSLTTEWKPYQIGPLTAVKNSASDERLIIERLGSGAPLMYLDNIELREVTENIFRIDGSWETPASCDQTPAGDISPQYMLGCRAFEERDNLLTHLKSFEKLCRPEAVGCEALYDTRNSESPYAQTFNAICTLPSVSMTASRPCAIAGKTVCEVVVGFLSCRYDADHEVLPANVSPTGDTARVAADGITYLVNDPRFRCEASNMGCTELGDRTMNSDRLAVQSWNTKLLKNLPSSYSTTLCKQSEEFCQAYTRSADSAQVYFKDPDTRVCEFSESVTEAANGVIGNGWFRKGSNEPCDPNFLEAGTRFGIWKNSDPGYDGWAGACESRYDMCKELIDPEDRSAGYAGGKPYYAILNDRLDTRTCQGKASLRQSPSGANDASACVLFWKTDDLKKTYDAKATYDKSELEDGVMVTPVSTAANTANVIIKVNRDRQCGEWLGCRSSETVFNPSTGQNQSVCTAFSLCAEFERVGNSTRCIRYVESSHAGQVLSPKVYESRDVSWQGMDYSGFGIPNRYPVEELVTVNVGKDENAPDMRLVRSIGACTEQYGYPCGPPADRGTCLGPTLRVCVYPIDGGRRATTPAELLQPQNVSGYPPASCRIYPQESAPFPSSVADPGGWNSSVSDVNNGNPVMIGPTPSFASANVCQRRLVNGVEVSSCECNYVIAKYGSETKYLPSGGADMPQGYCSGGTFDGYECDPAATDARSRTNLSCCSTKAAGDIFGGFGSGCDDGANCSALSKVDRVVGYEGQCLERDFTTPINGRSDQFACITWRPVNLVGGSRDIYNQNQTAGYFAPADRRFYCVGNRPAWSVILNIDPAKTLREQPINQFFGEGTYNNRVENYYSSREEGKECNQLVVAAGGVRWCIYPAISENKDVSGGDADEDMKWVISGNPIGMLGCYEVSDSKGGALSGTAAGPAEIVWPYIGPPVYRDQLKSIFFQVTDDIYHYGEISDDKAWLNGVENDVSGTRWDWSYGEPSANRAAGGPFPEWKPRLFTDESSSYRIVIPKTGGLPDFSYIRTNPNQDVLADCNDNGNNNIDSEGDDGNDSAPFKNEVVENGTVGHLGLYFINEANKWQVDASDKEGKIGFNAHYDANGRLKDIVLQAEGGKGSGTFGINAMGFQFKSGCEQVARVDVPGEYGLTKAYTNVLNPARNFERSGTAFQDVTPYGFTSYSQACQAYGAIGTISANPPTRPWSYVVATPRYVTVNGVVNPTPVNLDSNPAARGIEQPMQCTELSARTATRYGAFGDANENIRQIFRKVTSFWKYIEIATTLQLFVDNAISIYKTAGVPNETSYGVGWSAFDFDDTDDKFSGPTSGTAAMPYAAPPRIAAVDTASCDANGRCGSGRPDSITLNSKQDGLLLGADGAMNVSARFFAWASHDAMPIIRRTILWGDFTSSEPPAKGWYKNQKPFCSPDISDDNAVGECAGFKGLTCNADTDCPDDAACTPAASRKNSFGNTPGACSATPYQFDHVYACSLADLKAMNECAGPANAAANAPCYRVISGSPVCVYRPKVQIIDNWGWCNCTGSGCGIPGVAGGSGGAYGNACDTACPVADAKPWTEFAGEVRLAPTSLEAGGFTPGAGSSGICLGGTAAVGGGGLVYTGGGIFVGYGGIGNGSGGDAQRAAVNDSFTTVPQHGPSWAPVGGVFDGRYPNQSVLFNDAPTGPVAGRQVLMVSPPSHGTLLLVTTPTGSFQISAEGYFYYKGDATYKGTDSFTYKIVQSGVNSNTATVTLTIP